MKVDVNMEMFYRYVETQFCELGRLKIISKCDRSRYKTRKKIQRCKCLPCDCEF